MMTSYFLFKSSKLPWPNVTNHDETWQIWQMIQVWKMWEVWLVLQTWQVLQRWQVWHMWQNMTNMTYVTYLTEGFKLDKTWKIGKM